MPEKIQCGKLCRPLRATKIRQDPEGCLPGDWISFQPAIVASRLDLIDCDIAPSAKIPVEREAPWHYPPSPKHVATRVMGFVRRVANPCEATPDARPHSRCQYASQDVPSQRRVDAADARGAASGERPGRAPLHISRVGMLTCCDDARRVWMMHEKLRAKRFMRRAAAPELRRPGRHTHTHTFCVHTRCSGLLHP